MLKELMYYLPLWTIGSSAAVEGLSIALRVDKFVLLHLEWLVGELITAAPKMLMDKITLEDSINRSTLKNCEEQVIDSLNEEENWDNKTKQKALNDDIDHPIIVQSRSLQLVLDTNINESRFNSNDLERNNTNDLEVKTHLSPTKI